MTGSEESPLQTWSVFPLLCAPGDALASPFSLQKTETRRGSFVHVGSRRPLQAPLFLSGGRTAVPLEAGGGSGLVAGGRGAGAGAAPPSELWLCEWPSQRPLPAPALSSYTALLSLQTPLLPVPSGAPGPQPPPHLSSRCTAALTGLALVGVPGRTWAEPEAWATGYLGQGGRHAPCGASLPPAPLRLNLRTGNTASHAFCPSHYGDGPAVCPRLHQRGPPTRPDSLSHSPHPPSGNSFLNLLFTYF